MGWLDSCLLSFAEALNLYFMCGRRPEQVSEPRLLCRTNSLPVRQCTVLPPLSLVEERRREEGDVESREGRQEAGGGGAFQEDDGLCAEYPLIPLENHRCRETAPNLR